MCKRFLLAGLVVVTLVVTPPRLGAQEAPEEESPGPPSTLFESHEILQFTVEADFDQLKGDREQESEERPARLVMTNPEGEPIEVDMQVRTRGNYRLNRRNCSFPPIRLNLPRTRVTGTPFQGEDKLKLVVHCRDRDEYEDNVLKEYLVYRIYNLLTDVSFRVRLAQVTYVDTSGEDDPVTRHAFLIEDEDAMAARFGGQMVEVPRANPGDFQLEHAALLSLFQFMVGNTDWSMVEFHNIVLLVRGFGEYLPIPYDFDLTGLVDAPYAGVNPQLEHLQNDIRDRVYRGFCWPDLDYEAIYAQFNAQREAVSELVQGLGAMSEDEKEEVLEYIDEFYEVINNSRRADRQISGACRKY
jgi:hypothetical protein